MSARTAVRCSAIPGWLLIFLIGFTANGSAALIDNDVDISWSDNPCFPASGPTTNAQPLWQIRPAEELIPIVGAPRLVPNASNAGNLLEISVDFAEVSLADINPAGASFILNVFDLGLNPILGPGNVPLQLTYLIPNSPSLTVEANDAFFKLGDFDLFPLLPPGDLIFAVQFAPRFGLTDSSINRPDHVAIITLSGVGTAVPEPATLLLLISGVAITGMRARRTVTPRVKAAGATRATVAASAPGKRRS